MPIRKRAGGELEQGEAAAGVEMVEHRGERARRLGPAQRGEPLDHVRRGASVPSSRSAGWSSRLRPEQGHRLGHVADIVAAHVEQDRIDPFLGDRPDRRRLDRGQVELAGQRRQRIAAVGIGGALQIVADQLQLGVARAGVDERVEKLREVTHDRSMRRFGLSLLVAFGLARLDSAGPIGPRSPTRWCARPRWRLPGWPAGAAPVRAVLIADLHVAGPDMPPARLARIVAQVNALRPDLVLIAGDFISDKRTVDPALFAGARRRRRSPGSGRGSACRRARQSRSLARCRPAPAPRWRRRTSGCSTMRRRRSARSRSAGSTTPSPATPTLPRR